MRRITLITLWFLTGWMIGSMAAFVFGMSTALGPIVAVGAALVMAENLQMLPRVKSPSGDDREQVAGARPG